MAEAQNCPEDSCCPLGPTGQPWPCRQELPPWAKKVSLLGQQVDPVVEMAVGGTYQLVMSEGRSWRPWRPLGSWGSSWPNPRIPLGIEDATSHEGTWPHCQSGVQMAMRPAQVSARLDSPSHPWGPHLLGILGSPVAQCHPERQAGGSVMEKVPLSQYHLSHQLCGFAS